MAIKDLEPEGFNEAARTYAHWTKPADMYVQGMALREVIVWLRIDGMSTAIGFGEPDEALEEAEAWVEKQLKKIRASIEERKRAQAERGE